MDKRRIRQALKNIPAYKPYVSTLPAITPNMTFPYGNQGINGSQGIANELGLMASTYAGWVRLNFRLGSFSSWTQAALDVYDKIVNTCMNLGLNILGLMTSEFKTGTQTDWVANNSEQLGGSGDNTYIQGFANDAQTVASYFFPRVRMWEVWNEPDAWTSNPSDAIYTGGSFIYPSNFAWLLKRCYAAIKAAANYPSNVQVVSGGLFIHDLGPSIGDFAKTYYIPNLLNTGVAQFDYVGEHIYIDQGTSTTTAHIQTALNAVHNLIGKPMLVTEVGWKTSSVSQAVQAANLQAAFQTFQLNAFVLHAFWFAIQDSGAGNYGLYDSSSVAKTAFGTYKSFANY